MACAQTSYRLGTNAVKKETVITLPPLHEDQQRAYQAYRDCQYFVLRAGRRWGKSNLLVKMVANSLLQGKKVGFFVPEAKYASEPFLAIKSLLAPIIESSSRVEGVIRLIKTEKGVGRADFWSLRDNELAGRGRDYDVAIFDEHALINLRLKRLGKMLLDQLCMIEMEKPYLHPIHEEKTTLTISIYCINL